MNKILLIVFICTKIIQVLYSLRNKYLFAGESCIGGCRNLSISVIYQKIAIKLKIGYLIPTHINAVFGKVQRATLLL